MIHNDEELLRARQRLRDLEEILDSTWREVGHNPVQYKLFSAGTIDLIQDFRREIDEYLEPGTTKQQNTITISLDGPAVSLGRTSAGVVTRYVDTFLDETQAEVDRACL
jgi:hypothetical protein